MSTISNSNGGSLPPIRSDSRLGPASQKGPTPVPRGLATRSPSPFDAMSQLPARAALKLLTRPHVIDAAPAPTRALGRPGGDSTVALLEASASALRANRAASRRVLPAAATPSRRTPQPSPAHLERARLEEHHMRESGFIGLAYTRAASPEAVSGSVDASGLSHTRRPPLDATDFEADGSFLVGGAIGHAAVEDADGIAAAVASTATAAVLTAAVAGPLVTTSRRPLHVPYAPTIRPRRNGSVVNVMPALTQSDYVALADACQRAGRGRVEAHAHFKAAELMITERATRPQAAEHLVQYLNLSRRLEDLPGEAKALNALGVLYYQLALDSADTPGGADGRAVVDLLGRSLQYHRQHAAIADAAGVFIANTNAGLVYERLGDAAAAVEAHKLALTFAVQAGDKNAESVALANVAAAGATTGDAATTRLCGQRQLELADTLRSGAVSCEAHEQLGQLALQRGDFAGASTHLTAAFETAAAENDHAKSQRLRCLLGVVQSAARVDERMRTQAAAMGAR